MRLGGSHSLIMAPNTKTRHKRVITMEVINRTEANHFLYTRTLDPRTDFLCGDLRRKNESECKSWPRSAYGVTLEAQTF